jgi:hypothetical protein
MGLWTNDLDDRPLDAPAEFVGQCDVTIDALTAMISGCNESFYVHLTPRGIGAPPRQPWLLRPGATPRQPWLLRVVGRGQEVDVSDPGNTRSLDGNAKPPPIAVKKSTPDRVKSLLARFGQ